MSYHERKKARAELDHLIRESRTTMTESPADGVQNAKLVFRALNNLYMYDHTLNREVNKGRAKKYKQAYDNDVAKMKQRFGTKTDAVTNILDTVENDLFQFGRHTEKTNDRQTLWNTLDIDEVTWARLVQDEYMGYKPYATASAKASPTAAKIKSVKSKYRSDLKTTTSATNVTDAVRRLMKIWDKERRDYEQQGNNVAATILADIISDVESVIAGPW